MRVCVCLCVCICPCTACVCVCMYVHVHVAVQYVTLREAEQMGLLGTWLKHSEKRMDYCVCVCVCERDAGPRTQDPLTTDITDSSIQTTKMDSSNGERRTKTCPVTSKCIHCD